MTPNFADWLATQTDRDDPIGDLANDAASDELFPRQAKTYQTYRVYLQLHQACSEAVAALSQAWAEYQAALRSADRLIDPLDFYRTA